ncbi:MAG: DNA polymerase alpha catalytic subunit [Vezdaea aestivalis]|nr:MAG: DNA polymerase alpha catalytic subunit [Vezdaea aestivalis]
MASKRAALAELRALRQSGKSRLGSYQVQEDANIYDEVDEEGYKKVVRSRLDRDDFVIDDNGQGYADDGREDWAQDRRQYSDSEDEPLPVKGKAGKRKREEAQEKDEKDIQKINAFFKAGAGPAVPKPKPMASAADAAFLDGLLDNVDTNILGSRPSTTRKFKVEPKRKVRLPARSYNDTVLPTSKKPKIQDGMLPVTPPVKSTELDDDDFMPMMEQMDEVTFSEQLMPSSPVAKAVERKTQNNAASDDEDEELEVCQVVGRSKIATTGVNIAGSRPIIKPKKTEYPTPASSSPSGPTVQAIDAASWNEVNTKLNVISSPAAEAPAAGKIKSKQVVEDNGSLLMFWTDYAEIGSKLCLFGKVKDKNTGHYVSAFVQINNILRKLYFLPRQHHRADTSQAVSPMDVYNEVVDLMSRKGVKEHKMKESVRKYAFELPNVPAEETYLKLLYSYDHTIVPQDCEGNTFSRVFGTNTSLFEQFVLWRDIMGPCWLKIEDVNLSGVANASYCRFEAQADKPGSITPLKDSDAPETPKMNIVSMALRTILNAKENRQEIICASLRIYPNMSLNDTTEPEKIPCRTMTFLRSAEKDFPIGFDKALSKHRGKVFMEKSEDLLLSRFLAQLSLIDPDMLVGHQLQDVDLGTILSRFKTKNTPKWSRIGRLKRTDWPKSFANFGSNFLAYRNLVSGRLICDVANDMGKSLTTKCQSWSLTEMCSLYLPNGQSRQELNTEEAWKTWATSKDGLLNFLNHCEADTFFIAAIAFKIQIASLAKVLTNLAGNSWARTLSGTRAERNEYILLHEFSRRKYICPDKMSGKAVDTKKKDKYKGGLVFDPEKGLYDKYVLVMDFNSLYPSIIREYNICFTTVKRFDLTEDQDGVPDVPADQELGVLPRLIATLVDRRKAVKSLMRDKRATPEELATWDIKQTALKLTANSMYGCLGYERSRFYARPLATLTTSKGREILTSTKELAESNSLRVIYGDTDSVMINTNVDSIAEAHKIGIEFKKAVNERYRLLEIDIDNTFSRLLLQQKKKYAALNVTEVNGKFIDKLEVKGLDMRRREFCALSKKASETILHEIFYEKDREVVIEKIHEYLRGLSKQIREGKVPTRDLVIYTKLGKSPKDYGSAGDSQPQVQVALKELARGKTVRENDVMSYIITGDSKTSSESAAKRAHSWEEVRRPDSGLTPDAEWYISKQIFPPIERLCENVEGTDKVRLGECLGLDIRQSQTYDSHNQEQVEIFPLESQIDDSVRFQDCGRLSLRCRKCKQSAEFHGAALSLNSCTNEGVICPRSECRSMISVFTVAAQLEAQIRHFTTKYYDAYLVCDDSSCGARTRQTCVSEHRCLGPQRLAHGCSGHMRYEYSEKALYNQLLYFHSLWDVEKAKKAASGEEAERVKVVTQYNQQRFNVLQGVVQAYLKKCGRVWVQMDSLFGFAMK